MIPAALDRLATKLLTEFDELVVGRNAAESINFSGSSLDNAFLEAGVDALERLDAKAGALLTHISMMIAAASFMISNADTSTFERFIVGFEIVMYLFLALCCLRCLKYRDLSRSMRANTQETKEYQRSVRTDAFISGKILNFALRWTFLVTFVFMLSVLVHIFL